MSSLFVAWRPPETHAGWRPIGRLDHEEGLYRFCYTHGAKRDGFRGFRGMDQLGEVYESEELFPIFANRLLSKSRPEYESYLRWSGFDPASPPDPIVVLGVTEGLRQTDAIEVFPCPVPDASGCYFNKFFLHGIRWMPPSAESRIRNLEPDEPLCLMADMQNRYDPGAVAVRTEADRTMIGYVPRYLARDFWDLHKECEIDFIKLAVDRVNHDAPLQNRVLCKLTACWPDNFRPCSHNDFVPIPTGFPSHC